MTITQYNEVKSYLQKIFEQQQKILQTLKEIEIGFNNLPSDGPSQITGRWNKIIEDLRKEIKSVKDEYNA